MSTNIAITIYTRAGCHLCEEMRAVVEAVGRRVPLELEELDVDSDPVLAETYGTEVPVLCVNGRKAFKYRVVAAELMARLAREPRR